MTATLIRLRALVLKELQALFADIAAVRLLVMPVVMQLVLFPFAATLEVKNNTLGILDEDSGPRSAEVIARLSETPAFARIVRLRSEREMADAIDRQDALLVLRFGPTFSRSATLGTPEPAQALLDGRRSNSGQIALSYVQSVFQGASLPGATSGVASGPTVRNWYNANLDYYRFIVPSLVALITTLSALIVTAMSVAREREQGTLDQLLVSPLTPSLIFVGKAIPALIVAAGQATIILCAGIFAYRIPFQGSLPLLYACLVLYVFALVGVGLFVSSVCATQQQAFLGVFFFVMPSILLSGYISPIANMPRWLQLATWANPVRHFIAIGKSIYLKAAVPEDFAANLVALLVIGVVTSALALSAFGRRTA